MVRKLIAASLVVAVGSAPVLANDAKKQETCKITSGIVSAAVQQRAAGISVDTVKDGLAVGDRAVAEKYQLTIEPLVDWVYSLDATAVAGPGAHDTIAETYRKSCLGFDP